MKKHLLISMVALFLTGTAAKAQTLEFLYHGESLPDHATVTIAAEENDFGELACYTNPTTSSANDGLVLQVNAPGFGPSVNVDATMYILHNSLNAEILSWCMGPICYPMNDVEVFYQNITVPRDGLKPVDFEAEKIQATGYLKAELTIKYGDETRVVYIQFANGETDGIGLTPTLSQGVGAWYSLDGRMLQGEPTQKGVYILNGKKVVRY